MTLSEKMFRRPDEGCEPSSPCPEVKSSDGLFASDWEVFVIKHDKASGKHKWFTLCCEAAYALARAAAAITKTS